MTLQLYCQIKTYILPRSHPTAARSEAASQGVTRTNLERRERCFKFNSNPSISRDPPAQNLTFSIILSHSGSTLSNNPGTAVKSNELRLMWWSNFTQKQFSFKLLRCCDDVHRMFNTTFIRTKVVIINFTSSNLKWAWEGGGRTVTRIPEWSPVSSVSPRSPSCWSRPEMNLTDYVPLSLLGFNTTIYGKL